MHSAESFRDQGYLIQSAVYPKERLLQIRRGIAQNPSAIRRIWPKDACACSRRYLHHATCPSILETVRELLGEDVILWGGSYLERGVGDTHPWHTDIESSRLEGGFVSVWIGLSGVTRNSSLKLVEGSHAFGKPLQQVIQEKGKTRKSTTDDDVAAWAAELLPGGAGMVQPDIQDGDAIFFDGRLWHGSHNLNQEEARSALLFQFARADVAVRIPDYQQFAWPFRFMDSPLPPCLVVSGKGDPELNQLVERPPAINQSTKPLGIESHVVDVNACTEPGHSYRAFHLFQGRTPNLTKLAVHYSVLDPGGQPHPPHRHVDEELLMVLKGSANLRYDEDREVKDHIVQAGEGVFYPSFHRHTISNPSQEPIVYLMFKWVSRGSKGGRGGKGVGYGGPQMDVLGLQRLKVPALEGELESEEGFQPKRAFKERTHQLRALEAHVSTLLPEGGYAAHDDRHDVALLVFEGEIQVNGQKLGAHTLHFIPAGESHDMRNPSTQIARYLVIEFHGPVRRKPAQGAAQKPRSRNLPTPRRIMKKLRRLFAAKH